MADETEQNLDEKTTQSAKADALEDSSSESETQTEQGEKADGSLSDFVTQQLKERGDKVGDEVIEEDTAESEGEVEEADAKAKSKGSVSESETDKTETEEVEESEEADKTETKQEDGKTEGPVPYERFKEINEKATTLTTQVEEMKAEVEDYRKITGFLQRSGIDRELFTKTMLFLADFQAGNVEKVAPQIKEWAAAVDLVEGNKLPADIQKMVDEGLDITVAQRLAKAEAREKMVEKRGRKTVEQMQQEQFEQSKRTFDMAAEQWETAKRSADPDYKPKAKAEEPDGVWEDVQHVFHHLINQKDAQGNYVNPVTNAQALNALQERSYQMVQAKLKRYRGAKPEVKRPLDSKRGASGDDNGKTKDFTQAKTLGEAVRVGMRQLGHSWR